MSEDRIQRITIKLLIDQYETMEDLRERGMYPTSHECSSIITTLVSSFNRYGYPSPKEELGKKVILVRDLIVDLLEEKLEQGGLTSGEMNAINKVIQSADKLWDLAEAEDDAKDYLSALPVDDKIVHLYNTK